MRRNGYGAFRSGKKGKSKGGDNTIQSGINPGKAAVNGDCDALTAGLSVSRPGPHTLFIDRQQIHTEQNMDKRVSRAEQQDQRNHRVAAPHPVARAAETLP